MSKIAVRAGSMYLRESCTCRRVVRAGGLYVQVGSTYRWVVRARVVRAGGFYVQEGCTCSWVPRTGGLYVRGFYVQEGCTCGWILHAEGLYVWVGELYVHKCVTMSLCEWVEGRRVESLEIRKLPGEGVGAGGLGWQGRWGGGGGGGEGGRGGWKAVILSCQNFYIGNENRPLAGARGGGGLTKYM